MSSPWYPAGDEAAVFSININLEGSKFLSSKIYSWTINNLMIGINTRYVEGYSNKRQIPTSAISLGYSDYVKSFLVHDFSIKKTYQFSFSEMEIGIGIINAFDKEAPLLYDAPDFSFDTRVHDPRGRLINITAEFNF